MAWPFEPLQMFGFDVIMADPPWFFELRSDAGAAKSPQGQYACMPTAEIAALPVNQLASRDCWLWLWATYPMIRDGLAVMDAWGFAYVTGGTWVKRGASGKLAFGTGYVFRGNAELVLLGRVGNPPICSRSVRNVIKAPLRRHSEKPDEGYAAAEALFGPGRRADLFSRRTRAGWQAWGREAGLLDNGGIPEPRPTVPPAAAPVSSHPSLFEAAE